MPSGRWPLSPSGWSSDVHAITWLARSAVASIAWSEESSALLTAPRILQLALNLPDTEKVELYKTLGAALKRPAICERGRRDWLTPLSNPRRGPDGADLTTYHRVPRRRRLGEEGAAGKGTRSKLLRPGDGQVQTGGGSVGPRKCAAVQTAAAVKRV